MVNSVAKSFNNVNKNNDSEPLRDTIFTTVSKIYNCFKIIFLDYYAAFLFASNINAIVGKRQIVK